jgi:hypothetical protein
MRRWLTLTSEPDFLEYAITVLEICQSMMNGADAGGETASSDDFEVSYGDLGDTDELGNPSNFENWSHWPPKTMSLAVSTWEA